MIKEIKKKIYNIKNLKSFEQQYFFFLVFIRKPMKNRLLNGIKKSIFIIQFCIRYSIGSINNAITISSLIQIIIKLLLSLFSIKLNVLFQLCILFLLLPIYLNFRTFFFVRDKIADFLTNYILESSYEEAFDWEEFDGDFPEDAGKDYNCFWYNYFLLYFIHFLLFFRLLVLQEPFLALFSKFIAIRYFILNEFLFIAYFISFLFIFSCFVFLLTDKTMSKWKISLNGLLEKEQEIPKITKENIEIMTHWSLRDVNMWRSFGKKKLKKKK